jgi:ubiquinone/menaquinone biosynthesis C-methylase UbiE
MSEHQPPKFFDGGGYEKMMGRWSLVAGARFLEFLQPDQEISWLDVGCGNGAFSELLFKQARATRVDGIDPSDGLLQTARTRLDGYPAVMTQGDAQSLPYGDNQFDASVMALVINFIPDPAKAVAEMVRVTKPGGSVSSYIWDIEGGGFTMEPIRAALKTFGLEAPVTGPEKATCAYMENLWQTLGLQDIETTHIEVPLNYENFEDFWESNTGIPNSVANAVKKLAGDDVAKLKKNLEEELSSADTGSISYMAAVNAVKGKVAG